MDTRDLPALNAVLNGSAAVFLGLGLYAIRTGRRQLHQKLMLTALGISAGFLASYVVYHLLHGSTRFSKSGWMRTAYLGLLLSHTILAVINVPLVVVTVLRAWRGELARHKKIAKLTWVVWMYVSVTGVVIYLILYQWFPSPRIDPISLYLEARAFQQRGDEAGALVRYERAAALGHPGATCFAAVVRDRLSGSETASAAIARIFVSGNRDPVCQILSARRAMSAGGLARGLAELESIRDAGYKDVLLFTSLGFGYFLRLDYEKAAAAFEQAIALDASLSVDVFNAGYSHYQYGNYAAAEPLLLRAVSSTLPGDIRERATEQLQVIRGALWVCPMHPEVVGKRGESCRTCQMPLLPVSRGVPQ